MKKLANVGLCASPVLAQAATDITGVITEISGYMDAAIVVGVGVLLFVLGRRVIKKLV